MSYYTINLELNKQEPLDWKAPIEIAASLHAKSKPEARWNFNRYNNRISVRFDIEEQGKEHVEKVAQKMSMEGLINSYNWCEGAWDEPKFVQIAHEIATDCALKFKDEVNRDQELDEWMSLPKLNALAQQGELYKLISFFYCLTHSLLDILDFSFEWIWEYKRHITEDLETKIRAVASASILTSTLEQVNRINREDYPSFVERFIHLFFNCISRQNVPLQQSDGQKINFLIEPRVTREILDSVLWYELGKSRRAKTVEH